MLETLSIPCKQTGENTFRACTDNIIGIFSGFNHVSRKQGPYGARYIKTSDAAAFPNNSAQGVICIARLRDYLKIIRQYAPVVELEFTQDALIIRHDNSRATFKFQPLQDVTGNKGDVIGARFDDSSYTPTPSQGTTRNAKRSAYKRHKDPVYWRSMTGAEFLTKAGA